MSHIMQVATISFDRFNVLADEQAQERIRAARARLGERAVLLCHHYQRADVYQHADLTGDSLKLAKLASQTDAEYIVFCGVHFMAEVADILSKPHQVAILPGFQERRHRVLTRGQAVFPVMFTGPDLSGVEQMGVLGQMR